MVNTAFQPEIVNIEVADIIPIEPMTEKYRKTATYRRIEASMQHVGLIEPLVVSPTPNGKYLLLDGHTRLDVMLAAGIQTAKCLLATDNEAYTYNKRVNYVPPVAQHLMILRALKYVSEERIAKVLNVTVATIRGRRDLLRDICPEAVELLRNYRVTAEAFCALRKMKPIRQIDVAQLMVSARKFSARFVKALLNGTRDELLASVPKARSTLGKTDEQSIMEQETDDLLKHAASIEASYGNDVLNLTAGCKYIERMLMNTRVRRYLEKHHKDTLIALDQLLSEMAADKRRRPPVKKRVQKRRATAVGRQ